jgi:uncharacterized protein
MRTTNPRQLRLIAFFDGRAGHEKQTRGIIQALGDLVAVEVKEIRVKVLSPLAEFRQIARLLLAGRPWLEPRATDADLLLGTGSRTHLPLLLNKKKYGLPAVTCMSPPLYLRHRFDLCFVPAHDGLREQGNIVRTIGAPNCSKNRGLHRDDCGLILLGGIDPHSHRWDTAAITAMVRALVQAEPGRRWTVSSSPRTPVETTRQMEALASEFPGLNFFDFTRTQPGWIEEQYDLNRVVWVTSDSISMIYEALTAGCQVGILPMQWRQVNGKFKRNEDYLLSQGLVVSFSAWLQGNATWRDNIELNEARRCAERILRQWWPKN